MTVEPEELSTASPEESSATPQSEAVDVQVETLHNPLPISQLQDVPESRLQEYTMPATVFRKHLEVSKNEHHALETLYKDIDANLRTKLWEGISQVSELVTDVKPADAGSKSNLLTSARETSSSEVSSTKSNPNFEVSETAVSLQDVIANVSNPSTNTYLKATNSALPTFNHVDGTYTLSTIIEDSSSNKAAILEVICTTEQADRYCHALKYPFTNNMYPGSMVYIRNPNFMQDVSGKGFSIRVANADHVTFSQKPFQSVVDTQKKWRAVTECSTENSSASLWAQESAAIEGKYASEEWKQWGNEYFIARLHTQALFAYNIAVRFDPTNVDLIASRSSSLINLGMYAAAMSDVEFLIGQSAFNTGYIIRKVNCLCGLGKYEETIEYLRGILNSLEELPLDSPELDMDGRLKKAVFIEKMIDKTAQLVQQREMGKLYKAELLFRGSPKLYRDEPEYYKPVQVIPLHSPGGEDQTMVITKEKVAAGELLVVTKAFAALFLDNITDSLIMEREEELANLTIQKFTLEQPSRESFYKVEKMLDKKTNGNVIFSDEDSKPFRLTNAEIKQICESHFYAKFPSSSCEDTNRRASRYVGGLWTFPTHIRHKCVGGNAAWFTCGNLMFIRALRDIDEGEEITMAHVEPTASLEARKEFFNAREIQCSCALCQFELTESESVKLKRSNLLKEIHMTGVTSEWRERGFNKLDLKKLSDHINDLDILRSAYAKLNFPVVIPLYHYGMYLIRLNNFDGAITALEKAFYVVDDTAAIFDLMNISIHLAYCYVAKKKKKDKGKARKWFNALRTYAMLSYGCLDPIKGSFREIFEFLEDKGIAKMK